MKLHIGCGQTLINGFINIDNSPSTRLSRLPDLLLRLLRRFSLINDAQFAFTRRLKASKKEFLRSDCLRLPFREGTVDFCYSSHMVGWCLSLDQLNIFFSELHRIMRPGAGMRLSFFDLDQLLDDYRQHRSTIRLMEQMPLGTRSFYFKEKLKFLFSPNMQNGIPLNAETITHLLEQRSFQDIRRVAAGETTMEPAWVEGVDLSERAGASIYIECRKAIAPATHPPVSAYPSPPRSSAS